MKFTSFGILSYFDELHFQLGHDGLVSCGSFSHCGKFVCTAGEDGSVRIWLPKTGACKHVFDGHDSHQGPITCLSVADDMILTGNI